jgi:UDP-N-acetylmuramyl tripeptide synthase
MEVDEAVLPHAANALKPRAIVFTNLFRDQLDRYGELEHVMALWHRTINNLSADTVLILNADDPSIAELVSSHVGPVHWFGLEDSSLAHSHDAPIDARWCSDCENPFVYQLIFSSHLGWWRCNSCDKVRPKPDTAALNVHIGVERAQFDVPDLGNVELPFSGTYNVSNALAAISAARTFGLTTRTIATGIGLVKPAFGRQETINYKDRKLHIFLTKNPAGANEVLHFIASSVESPAIAIILNDRIADGRDVSWIWDVDYERLSDTVQNCWASGDRAADLALRFNYAGWPNPLATIPRVGMLLDQFVLDTLPGDDIYLMPTYTALLDLYDELQQRGVAHASWRSKS